LVHETTNVCGQSAIRHCTITAITAPQALFAGSATPEDIDRNDDGRVDAPPLPAMGHGLHVRTPGSSCADTACGGVSRTR
jgi:hypothetical protein